MKIEIKADIDTKDIEKQGEFLRKILVSLCQDIPQNAVIDNPATVKVGLLTAYVSNLGILYKGSKYWSDELIDLLGMRVLVSDSQNGKISVYSTEGQYITDAFILKKQ